MDRVAIEGKNLTKSFGKLEVLSNLSFTLHSGEIVCILGPKNSGKTTFLKTLLHLVCLDSGKITYFGHSLKEINYILNFVGYFSTSQQLYPKMKVIDFLLYLNSFYDGDFSDNIHKLCIDFKINEQSKIKNLKEDELNRIRFINALFFEPEIIILDDLSKVDISLRNQIISILLNEKKKGTAILVSSDSFTLLNELECSSYLLQKGQLVTYNKGSNPKKISFCTDKVLSKEDLENKCIRNLKILGTKISFLYEGDWDYILSKFQKWSVKDLTIADCSDEEIFESLKA